MTPFVQYMGVTRSCGTFPYKLLFILFAGDARAQDAGARIGRHGRPVSLWAQDAKSARRAGSRERKYFNVLYESIIV